LSFWRVLSYRQPIVDLRAYRNRNFAFGSFFTFVVGIGMYGTTYLVPLVLAQVRGYNALQIGLTIIVTGLVTMVMSPLSTIIARHLDLRLMLAIGFGLFAYSMYLTAILTNQTRLLGAVGASGGPGAGALIGLIPSSGRIGGRKFDDEDPFRQRIALQQIDPVAPAGNDAPAQTGNCRQSARHMSLICSRIGYVNIAAVGVVVRQDPANADSCRPGRSNQVGR
jgi:hypothetical protein